MFMTAKLSLARRRLQIATPIPFEPPIASVNLGAPSSFHLDLRFLDHRGPLVYHRAKLRGVIIR
jgi:hypothetical protein